MERHPFAFFFKKQKIQRTAGTALKNLQLRTSNEFIIQKTAAGTALAGLGLFE
jgi:hypothetical protein